MYSTLLRANIHPCIDNSQKNSPDSTDACYSHPNYTEQMYANTRQIFQDIYFPLIATSVCLNMYENMRVCLHENMRVTQVLIVAALYHKCAKASLISLSLELPQLQTCSTVTDSLLLFHNKVCGRYQESSEGAKCEDTPVQICLTCCNHHAVLPW